MCPDEQKYAVLEDINLLEHTKTMKTVVFFQYSELTLELGAKVHMDTLGMNWGPQGAPKIAQKSLKNGF